MTTVLLISGVFTLIVLLGVLCFVAYNVLAALGEALQTVNRLNARQTVESQAYHQTIKGLVDRIMSGDWEQVRTFESADEADEGGFFTPEEQDEEDEEEIVVEARSWGHVNALKDRFDNTEEEEALLREDFPDEAGVPQ